MAVSKSLVALLLLAFVSLAAGVSRKQCLQAYQAQLNSNARTGRYDNYKQLADKYVACLNSADSDGYGRRKLLEPSAQAKADCTEAYHLALQNAQAAKDQTAAANLGRAYQGCVTGGK